MKKKTVLGLIGLIGIVLFGALAETTYLSEEGLFQVMGVVYGVLTGISLSSLVLAVYLYRNK